MENPHTLLYQQPFMSKLEPLRSTCTYCTYGTLYRKPTDIWSNIPLQLTHCASSPCKAQIQFGRHLATAQRGPSPDGTPGTPYPGAMRVPVPLCMSLIKQAVKVLFP